MGKLETAITLEAFMMYMEHGGISLDFLGKFQQKFGKGKSTAYGWEKDLDWKERAKQPIQEAVEELTEAQKLNAEEVIIGLLDLCQTRMDGLSTKAGYIDAIFSTAFDKIQAGQLKVETISDLAELIRAQSRLVRDEQAFMRLVLTLVGKPETIMEERMIVEFAGLPDGFYDDSREGEAG